MKEKTDIWFYIIGPLICLSLLALPLAIAIVFYGNESQSFEYKRGYMDGFREGMLMNDMDYGTIKLERNGVEK